MNKQLIDLGSEILSTARNDLYLSMRFLDVALSGLTFEMSPLIATTATDGEKLYIQPKYLLTSYEENPVLINRAYLHNLLHCLFSHLYLNAGEDRELWDLCCDICVESIIDSLDAPCLRKMYSPIREQTYRFLNEKIALYTPGRLYRLLSDSVFYRQNMLLLIQDFCLDSHEFWPQKKRPEQKKKRQQQEEKWQELGDKTRTSMETFERRAGKSAGHLLETLKISYGDSTRYDQFLKRFATWRETIHINEDEFDTAYYTLGMDMYGNIPLIEPLEYKEEKKIHDLVIAVDTSGSVRGTPVRQFLSETFAILQNSRHFFKHLRIHLLQFDTIIQEDTLITTMDQLSGMAESFTVKGFGGTDYRCVFQYIEELKETGRGNPIQGLMILTDGYGTCPTENPGYPVAFLLADFLKEDSLYAREPAYDRIPDWAIRLNIKPDLERSLL